MERAGILFELARLLGRGGKFIDAAACAREAWKIRQKFLPASDWNIADARARLGENLFEAKKYAEAETELLASFEEMRDRRPTGTGPLVPIHTRSWHNRVRTVAGKLVLLYHATKRRDEAAEWERRLAELADLVPADATPR